MIPTYMGLVQEIDDHIGRLMAGLKAQGRLQDVQPAINAIADPVQRGMVQIEWDDSQEFQRTRPTLIALATAIGMTEADLDNLFTQAAQL